MNDRYDVVIVGGAVIGSEVAYFLAANPDFDGRILVVERDPTYLKATTSLSSSSIHLRSGDASDDALRADQIGRAAVSGYVASIKSAIGQAADDAPPFHPLSSR